MLLSDGDATLKRAVARELGGSENAPRHLVLALSQDSDDVKKFVAGSPLLIDAELVEMVESSGPEIAQIIASRPYLATMVVRAILALCDPHAIRLLLDNPTAALDHESLISIVEHYHATDLVRDALVRRENVPASVRQHLVFQLGQAMCRNAADENGVVPPKTIISTRESCERATLKLADQLHKDDIEEMVEHLVETKQLNTSIVLRSICIGQIGFFVEAFAQLSGMKRGRVTDIMADEQQTGFAAIYQRAGLPKSAFNAFEVALQAVNEATQEDGIASAASRYAVACRVIETILHDCSQQEKVLDELLMMLRKLSAYAAKEAALERARGGSGQQLIAA